MAYQYSCLVKYSNGGCSGLEPDSLLHLLSKKLFKPYLLISYSIDTIIPRLRFFCNTEMQYNFVFFC